jgi:predicted transcriptional regulator
MDRSSIRLVDAMIDIVILYLMRTVIDIPDETAPILDALAKRQKKSRAAVIREAIQLYLASRVPQADDEAFGLWNGHEEDGVDYQQRLREEW